MLHHGGLCVIREETERLDGGAIESNHRGPHGGGQVKQAGVTDNQHLGALQDGRGDAEVEASGRTDCV